ncbi:MAG: acetyl-CoA carboxylase biotin carboxylase subunit, partial [Bdellovibrionales bacterium]|nr:acetyl-CoA carboxylase biotin carboxylase subunit [Bdellovibrionales bacterium]
MDNTFSANKKMKRVLIANRGEIALRVKRAALKLGITPVMLSSEADRQSRHAGEDVEVLWLKGSAAQETYLNAQRIVELAKEAKCDGVHPGYGFLSENAEFAELVTSNGMKFIGPSAEVIALMGDKLAAKAVAKEAGVPMASSVEVKDPAIALKKIESEVGFPVLLKAKAGGGGRGMRLVRDAKLFQSECERAQAEALKYFGNGTV